MKLRRYIEDQLLSWLQRHCDHPGDMVAVDILEGCGDYEIAYCRRCGAVSPRLSAGAPLTPYGELHREWRTPSPNLWRGV
jgi:hypothetical protein